MASKLWTIRNQHKAKIVELFSKHYDILEADGGESPVAAAKPAYRPNYSGRGYGRNYYYFR
jgi:hypothetical protein